MENNELEQKLGEIKQALNTAMTLEELQVTAEGTHFKIIAVGDCFDGLSKIKQQQAIYGPLMDKVTSGELHAITIKTFTPTQWKREKVFNMV